MTMMMRSASGRRGAGRAGAGAGAGRAGAGAGAGAGAVRVAHGRHEVDAGTGGQRRFRRAVVLIVTMMMVVIVATSVVHASGAATTPTATPPPTPVSPAFATSSTAPLKYFVTIEHDDDDETDRMKSTTASSPSIAVPSAAMEGGEVILMTASNRRKFRCVIPPRSSPSVLELAALRAQVELQAAKEARDARGAREAAAAAAAAQAHAQAEADASTTSKTSSSPPAPSAPAPTEQKPRPLSVVRRELHDLKGKCTNLPTGWWTYRVCPFSEILQFHEESSQVSTKFSLGLYSRNDDEWSPPPAPPPVLPPSLTPPSALAGVPPHAYVYTQTFVGGSGDRRSVVRYHCDFETRQFRLVGVTEPIALHYQFDIVSSLICELGGVPPPPPPPPPAAGPPTQRQAEEQKAQGQAHGQGQQQSNIPAHLSHVNLQELPGESAATSSLIRALQLLLPLGIQCLENTEEFWTYRFCYMDGIAQFHRDTKALPPTVGADGAGVPMRFADVTTQEYSLGLFKPENRVATSSISTSDVHTPQVLRSLTRKQVLARSALKRGSSWSDTYVRQVYDDGTPCDLENGMPRRTEVRFYCDSSSFSNAHDESGETAAAAAARAAASANAGPGGASGSAPGSAAATAAARLAMEAGADQREAARAAAGAAGAAGAANNAPRGLELGTGAPPPRKVIVRQINPDGTKTLISGPSDEPSTTRAPPLLPPVVTSFSVNEVGTCRYVVSVKLRELCSHEAFKPQLPRVHEITCSPVSSQESSASSTEKAS